MYAIFGNEPEFQINVEGGDIHMYWADILGTPSYTKCFV